MARTQMNSRTGNADRRTAGERPSANRKYASSTYVEGNTVRVAEPLEVPERRRREGREKEDWAAQRRVRQIRRNRDKALQVDLLYVLFMAMAAVVLMTFCVRYIQVQSDITTAISAIETAETQLEDLKAGNDLLESQIRTYVDLDYIYQVATEELGMVYPASGQVIYYDRTESEYVRQYESIP